MANQPRKPITLQQIQDVENLLQTLKEKAQAAHQANDVYMNGIYAELVKIVSPITTRANARLHREDSARINKGVRELRKGQQQNTKKTPHQQTTAPTPEPTA